MATEVNLPALGESVTEGTVTRWLKQVGDEVKVDEPLLEVSTDKVDTEIPSPVAGTLLEIKAEEDDTVEVGAVLAMIGDEGEGGGSDDSGESEDSGESDDSAGGGEDVEQEKAEADAEERDSGGEAPSEQEPAAEDEQQEEEQQEEEPAAESKPSGGKSEGGGSGTPVTLPALGESVTEGTVTRWLKQVGDEVKVDEPLLEVSTDKVDTEIPSPVAGTLLEIKVEEDETVEVGAELAIVGSGEASPADSGEDKSEEKTEEPEPEPEAEEEPERRSRRKSRPRPKNPSRRRSPSRSPRRKRRRPPPPRSPIAASRRRTSPHWSARWPPSTTWTCPPSPEQVSADGSASRTCSTRPRARSSPPRRSPAPPPRRRRPRPNPRRCVARPSRSRACAR